ncbi:hypothetical protein [Pyxidicoccus xibeiensis]|uniref:hypothetical protein n=1 Tax=Pyxidicoccus xibeiensis TaxID=2906759 RepID=UPI0020A7D00B|nr:hypothetical protein [Pyxidicoccus xibeiensis]MCP3142242.1 hypothetical protein [Pyxidicoccus xibeiensis]
MRAPVLAALLLLGASEPVFAQGSSRPAAPAAPVEDWFASMYTPGGLEVRADLRVFTLFALLNRAGYDAGIKHREHPVPFFLYHPARTYVRDALEVEPTAVLAEAQAFFHTHPVPIEAYLSRLLDGAPEGPGARGLDGLDGLEALLDRVEAEWPIAALREETLEMYRAQQQAWLLVLDEPLQHAARLLGLPEGKPALQVVVNLLDADGSIRLVETGRGWVVVVGPTTHTPNMEPVVRELARGVLSSRLAGRLEGRWAGGAEALRKARTVGAGEASVGEYGVALVSRALALRATGAQEAAYEAAGRQGYFGLKTLVRSIDDSRPVDAWALEGLARAVSGQALRK